MEEKETKEEKEMLRRRLSNNPTFRVSQRCIHNFRFLPTENIPRPCNDCAQERTKKLRVQKDLERDQAEKEQRLALEIKLQLELEQMLGHEVAEKERIRVACVSACNIPTVAGFQSADIAVGAGRSTVGRYQ